jgi:hypothetical protein
MDHHEPAVSAIKTIGDAASIVTVVGTFAQILPPLAALFTIVWTSIRIYETETVQTMLGRRSSRPSRSERGNGGTEG